ncbi:MAG: hypothetical protein R3F19_01805 [Verrucomicrobiales bacterium]
MDAAAAGEPMDVENLLSNMDGRGLVERDSSGQLVDSWGHPLLIKHTEHRGTVSVVVTSTGRDGKLGTSDDFSKEVALER